MLKRLLKALLLTTVIVPFVTILVLFVSDIIDFLMRYGDIVSKISFIGLIIVIFVFCYWLIADLEDCKKYGISFKEYFKDYFGK